MTDIYRKDAECPEECGFFRIPERVILKKGRVSMDCSLLICRMDLMDSYGTNHSLFSEVLEIWSRIIFRMLRR